MPASAAGEGVFGLEMGKENQAKVVADVMEFVAHVVVPRLHIVSVQLVMAHVAVVASSCDVCTEVVG